MQKFLIKIKKSLISIGIFLAPINMAEAKIIEIDKAEDILNYTQNLPYDAMVTFDVKNVLFVPNDKVLIPLHKKTFRESWRKLENNVGREKAEQLRSIIIASYKPVLVDPKMPEVIKKIQQNATKVIGLTSGHIGPYFTIASREELRLSRLRSLGIDFSRSFPGEPEIKFFDQYGKVRFSFHHGVLFATRIPKGEVMQIFIERTAIKLSKLVHVDNSMPKLISMEEFCKNHNIDYTGIYFTAIYKSKLDLDTRISDKQFEILQKEERWISEEEAGKLL